MCEACKGFGKEIKITFEDEEHKVNFQKQFCFDQIQFDRNKNLKNITNNYIDCPYAVLAEYIWNHKS